MLILSLATLAAIQVHLEAGYPREACGILVGTDEGGIKRVAYAVPAGNAWPDGDAGHDQRDRYLINPEDIARADREALARDLDIVGFFHSHPDWPSTPSETDRALAWPVVSFVIASLREGKMSGIQSWTLVDDGARFEEESIQIT